MASFSKEIDESCEQFLPINLGEVTPETLRQILEKEKPSSPENQDSAVESQPPESQEPPTQPLPSRPPPLSPQLLYSQTPKPPRKPPGLPRIVSTVPSPPKTLTPTTDRSYVSVPLQWCLDSKVRGPAGTYLSRHALSRKMFTRRLLYRKFDPLALAEEFHEETTEPGVEDLGDATDYWLCFPLKPPNRPECAEPLPLEDEPLSPDQEIAHAWLTGKDIYPKHTLDRVVHQGPEPVDTLPFPWVTNPTSTKVFSLKKMNSLGINKIYGYVECPKCGSSSGVSLLLPDRFKDFLYYLKNNSKLLEVHGEKALRHSTLTCLCDGKEHKMRPFISKDWNKINWLFLVLGFYVGYCKREQLKYFFCSRNKKLSVSGTNNDLLLRVCVDICEQLYPGCYSNYFTFMEVMGKSMEEAWSYVG